MAEDGSKMVWEAVAGELMDGKTQPDLQDVADIGPIPEGEYGVDFDKTVKRSELDIVRKQIAYPQASWGNYFVNIQSGILPNGRGGFSIHGGSVPGSNGCIDLHKNADSFFGMMLSRKKSSIPLSVRYK